MQPNYTYHATVVRVVDADTIDVNLDYGDYLRQIRRLRVAGVDAPERYTELGKVAALYVSSLLPVGAEIVVTTSKPDKYGRQLATVQLPDGRDLAADLLGRTYAVAYSGGARDVSDRTTGQILTDG